MDGCFFVNLFATFDLIDINENHIAQGHKASFCLEDNECYDNGNANYVCADYGDQGISVNCGKHFNNIQYSFDFFIMMVLFFKWIFINPI